MKNPDLPNLYSCELCRSHFADDEFQNDGLCSICRKNVKVAEASKPIKRGKKAKKNSVEGKKK